MESGAAASSSNQKVLNTHPPSSRCPPRPSQEGVEELNGGLAHKDPLLCMQLAVAMALFQQFNMRNYPPPDFSTPDWYNRPFACSTSHDNAVSWEVRPFDLTA